MVNERVLVDYTLNAFVVPNQFYYYSHWMKLLNCINIKNKQEFRAHVAINKATNTMVLDIV